MTATIFVVGSFQTLPDIINVKNSIFEVSYSQRLEQPLWLIYSSSNRPSVVNRKSMDFYTEKNIHTSDGLDYASNVYDKGHLAPAATFSDNMENLKQTFSYLNCALQNQYLNRGEWRMLEEQIRKWDDSQTLVVKIIMDYSNSSKKLTTGATVPDGFHMFIRWSSTNKKECYYFKNERPTTSWREHKSVTCAH
jgi:endonuclease G